MVNAVMVIEYSSVVRPQQPSYNQQCLPLWASALFYVKIFQ